MAEVSQRPKNAGFTFNVSPERQAWVEQQVRNVTSKNGAGWAIKVTQLSPEKQRIQLESWRDGFYGLIYDATPNGIVPIKTRYAGPTDSMIVVFLDLLFCASLWFAAKLASRILSKPPVIESAILAMLLVPSVRAQTVQKAEKFPGADAGERITHCLAALPPQGGICDARELSGNQIAAHGLTVGEPGKPVELMLGPVTLAVGGTVHLQRRSSIVGMPAGSGIGTDQSATVIRAADNSELSAVVQMDGALAVLQDLTVDGNRKGAPRGGTAILVNQGNRAELFRVTAQNAPGYGIEIYSSPRNESCCAKLQKVMAIANARAGLHVASTADVFISLSEFENNGTFGIELNNSPTTRIEHSDIGGNGQDGIRIYGTTESRLQSHRQIIVGNQFGNNGRYDIAIAGFDEAGRKHVSTGNLISSNEFIGSPTRPAGYDAIHVVDSADNTIVANTFSAPRSNPYRSCISISGDREGKDQVSGNTCTSSAASKDAFSGTATTVFGPNQGKNAPTPQPSSTPN